MIVCFAASKGGVGKSTACAAIGAGLAQCDQKVLVIDLDNETKTVARWGRKFRIPGLTVEAVKRESFTTIFRERRDSGAFDHILIDVAGTREATALKVIARSDLVIIPAQPSEPDLREARVVSADVRDSAETMGRVIPYRILLTKMAPLRTRVTDHVYQELERLGMPFLRTVMVERVAYREMFFHGGAPMTKDIGGAGAEVLSMIMEMTAIVDQAKSAGQVSAAMSSLEKLLDGSKEAEVENGSAVIGVEHE